jgi:hypothetical protein
MENYRFMAAGAQSIIKMDYQTINRKNRPMPDNIGVVGAMGGFLLTNEPIIFSIMVL